MNDPAADNIFFETFSLGGNGPRVAVKDTIDVAGHSTVAGCRALRDAGPAERHAEVVERVLAAGCRIVGKTNLHELTFGVTGINDWTGTPTNPRFPRSYQAVRPAVRPPPSPRGSPTSPSGPTRAARFASPPPAAGCSD